MWNYTTKRTIYHKHGYTPPYPHPIEDHPTSHPHIGVYTHYVILIDVYMLYRPA